MRWKRTGIRLLLYLLAVGSALAGAPLGSEIPKLHGETLDGQKIVLPDAAAGRITLLVLGFSRKGGDRTGPWRERFVADFGANPHATFYVAAMLEDVPGFIRGMIRAGIRGGTPQAMRAHALTTATDGAAWTRYLDLKDDSLPAVLLIDRTGHVLWSYNGVFDAARYQTLKAVALATMN